MSLKRSVTLDVSSRPVKRTRKNHKKKAPVAAPTRSAIQKAIAASRETKTCYASGIEQSLNTVGSYGFKAYSWAVPANGTDSTDRIGNKINPTRLQLRLICHNNMPVTLYQRLLVLRVKQGNAIADANIADELFDNWNGQDKSVQGVLSDLVSPINGEEYVVMHDEVVEMGYTTANMATASSRAYSRVLSFTPLKNMTFDDKDGHQPTTNRYVFCVITKRADADESTGESIELTYDVRMEFKD